MATSVLVAGGYTSYVLRTLPWITKVKSSFAHSVFCTIVIAVIFMYDVKIPLKCIKFMFNSESVPFF